MKLIALLLSVLLATGCAQMATSTPSSHLTEQDILRSKAIAYLDDIKAAIDAAIDGRNHVQNIAYDGSTGTVFVQAQQARNNDIRLELVAGAFTDRRLRLTRVLLTTGNPKHHLRVYHVAFDNGGSMRFREVAKVRIPAVSGAGNIHIKPKN